MQEAATARNPWVSNPSVECVLQELLRLDPAHRHLVAIAGAPGSGKSTFADYLEGALNEINPGSATIVPMDGFHFDDAVLRQQNTLARKGAPFTFDTGGMASTLHRLKENLEPQIAVPVFDRGLEISRASGRLIPQTTPILLVEGNYLLLDTPPWNALRAFFDLTVLLSVPLEHLERRLVQRWLDHGFAPAAAAERARGNDLQNAGLVVAESAAADFTLTE